MRNILSRLEFHYTYVIVAFGLVITGHFSNLLIFSSLIIIHEMGHVVMAKLLLYDIDRIVIYPYGGLTKLNSRINTRIEKDLLIAISGVIMQYMFFGFIFILYRIGLVREYIYNLFYLYNTSMLIFNLLPIYPLDGAKIVNLLLSKFFCFNTSNYMTVFISFIVIVCFLFSNSYERNYSLLITIGILMQNIYKFYRDISFIYNRFILERYLYRFNYKKKKVIRDKNKMYKNRYHIFDENGVLIEEEEYIKFFLEKRP